MLPSSISTQSPVWYPVSDTLVGRPGSKHSMQLCLNEKRHQHVCHAVVQLREHTLPTASRSFRLAKVGSRTTGSLSPGRTREQAVTQARHQQVETTPKPKLHKIVPKSKLSPDDLFHGKGMARLPPRHRQTHEHVCVQLLCSIGVCYGWKNWCRALFRSTPASCGELHAHEHHWRRVQQVPG